LLISADVLDSGKPWPEADAAKTGDIQSENLIQTGKEKHVHKMNQAQKERQSGLVLRLRTKRTSSKHQLHLI
jgi:hypothetical protein